MHFFLIPERITRRHVAIFFCIGIIGYLWFFLYGNTIVHIKISLNNQDTTPVYATQEIVPIETKPVFVSAETLQNLSMQTDSYATFVAEVRNIYVRHLIAQ